MLQRDRRKLHKLIRESGSDETRLRHEFDAFQRQLAELPASERPYSADILDVLLAFGPSRELAHELAERYYGSSMHGGA